MDIEKLNERLQEKLTLEEYQQLSALMFRTLDKYFWDKGGKKNGDLFGKTVFLTREEAEKALKERKQ